MLTMDVFRQDAFSALEMTTALDKEGYVPGFLGSLPGLFVPKSLRTETVMIEQRENEAVLIQTSARGAPPAQRGGTPANVRAFRTPRLAKGSRITASELANIRQFGSETELKQLGAELALRQKQLRQDMDLTLENLRLGAVLGLVVDADATTIYDWEAEFGATIPVEIDFDLDNASPSTGAVRKKCNQVRRSMLKALKGMGGDSVVIHAICGDDFYDLLVNHPEVEKTYLNTLAAAELRGNFGGPWESFRYGNIIWHNYRGTDDGTTVGVNAALAKFFPAGAGIFQLAMSPGESFDLVNRPGQLLYSQVVLDNDRNSFVDVEIYSYPLPVCTMPGALHRARKT